MPPKTRGPRKALGARQEEEEEAKVPAIGRKRVPKAKAAAKDPDKVSTDVPDKRSKVRTTAKVTFADEAASQKPTKGKKGGGRQKQKKEGEGQTMALTGRKRRQGAAASSADSKVEEGVKEEVKEDTPPPSKKRKDAKSADHEPVEETDRAIIAKVTTVVSKQRKKKAGKQKETSPMEEGAEEISHHSHSTASGQVMVMGQGDMGQLGLGEEMVERKKPFPVGGALEEKKVVQVVCGGMHTAALTKNGRVFTWGCNDEGALGRAVGDDGEEFVAGEVERLSGVKVVQISAGDSHTAALTSNGSIYCWGVFRDSNGAFGLVQSSPSLTPELIYSSPFNRAIKIASGSDHVAFLTEHGDIYTFGCAEQGQLGRVPECFSSRGGRKGMGLVLHPDIVRYRMKKGLGKPKFRDIFCGPYHTFAVTQDGNVYTWGLNNYGQLGTGDMQTRYQPELLQRNWVKEEGNEVHRSFEVAGGQHHSVFCLNGSVYVCGRKEYGRLGLGKESSEPSVPTKIEDLTSVRAVGAGGACSFAVTDNGELFSWGMGTNLQLGMAEEEDVWTPAQVTGKKIENRRILAVSSGGQHTAVLVSHDDT